MREDRTPSRREVLGAIGGSFGLAGIPSTVGAKTDDYISIVTARSFDGEVVETEQVPQKWHNHIQEARNAKEQLAEEYPDRDTAIGTVSLTKSSERIDGYHGRKIQVEIHNDNHQSGSENTIISGAPNLPEQINGIPVSRTPRRQKFRTCVNNEFTESACQNIAEYNNIPGGVLIEGENSLEIGTTGWPGNIDGHSVIFTASHIFRQRNNCQEDILGDLACQLGNSVGDVVAFNGFEDWAAIKVNSSKTIDNSILLPDGTRFPIEAYLTSSGIQTAYEKDHPVYKMGISTGLQNGEISATNVDGSKNPSDCIDHGGEGIITTTNNSAGDSGGPLFVPSNGKAYLVSMAQFAKGQQVGVSACIGPENEGYPVGDLTLGTSAYQFFS